MLQLQSDGDLSGTYVSGSQPIGVVSGNIQTTVAPPGDALEGTSDDSHLIEVMPPEHTYGTRFYVGPMPNRTMTLVKIVTSFDATTVKFDTTTVVIVSRGNTYTTRLYAPAKITSDKPILVGQVCTQLYKSQKSFIQLYVTCLEVFRESPMHGLI